MAGLLKWWHKYSMFCHLGSWIIIAVFLCGGYLSEYKAQAATIASHENRISMLETSYARTGQEVHDIVEFWRVPHKE